MAYRFKLDEPIDKGVRRIAGEQIARALKELGNDNVSAGNVHETRKTMKRLRALLRLMRPQIGEKAFKTHNGRLKKAAELLAGSRDLAILNETVAKLTERYGRDHADAVKAASRALASGTGAAQAPLDNTLAGKARALLSNAADEFAKLKLTEKGFAALTPGLEECCDKGRRALTKAIRAPGNEAYHDLRKAVQWHWRQMALLSRCWPDYFELRMTAARELSQILGDDHDLAVLDGYIRKHEDQFGAYAKELLKLIHGRQIELRRDSRDRAERLFAERSHDFVHRVQVYWRTGRRLKPVKGHVDDDKAHLEPPAADAQNASKLVTKAAQ